MHNASETIMYTETSLYAARLSSKAAVSFAFLSAMNESPHCSTSLPVFGGVSVLNWPF